MEFIWLIGFVLLFVVAIFFALVHAYQLGGKNKYDQGYDACEMKYLKSDAAYRKALEQGRITRGYLD